LKTKTPLGYISHVIYSDDHGENWHIGSNVHPGTNECTLVYRADGALLINMRNIPYNNWRSIAVSRDGGMSFEEFRREETMIDPCCQGSMMVMNTSAGEVILCSNASHRTNRLNMSIHESWDGGATWNKGLTVDEGISAYSDMASPEENVLGILYEGGSTLYEKIIWKMCRLEA
jgi:sialidase-1